MNEVEALKDRSVIDAYKRCLTGRDRLLFIVGTQSGLRISDILPLTIGDLRGKTHYSLVEKKTNKAKRFRLSDEIREEVAKLTGPDDEHIFKSRKGDNKPISRVQAYRILNDATARVNEELRKNRKTAKLVVEGAVGTHTLRKTFGYQAYKKGVAVELLQKIFNHSSASVTLRYIGITQDDIDDVYVAVDW